MKNFETPRDRMIERHLKARGIKDAAVLEAMRSVPREAFLPESMAAAAYEDSPLPIGHGQTISQPYIVALMTALIEPAKADCVLEIGTGSGYAAAILSRIVEKVYTVERHQDLAETAENRFRRLGYDNIHVHHGDGSLGWPEHAPYDGIVLRPEPRMSRKRSKSSLPSAGGWSFPPDRFTHRSSDGYAGRQRMRLKKRTC
jgi:protein-L-isoaspartate(D-aspartate) O-methyltransferase